MTAAVVVDDATCADPECWCHWPPDETDMPLRVFRWAPGDAVFEPAALAADRLERR